MKLILSSAGFCTEEIIVACEELVGKSRDSINVAIINEGYSIEHKDNLNNVLDSLNNVRSIFGGNLELVNLLTLDAKTVKTRISLNDIIFVVGSHTDYLMDTFNKSGFSRILPELLKTKVYVGSSAGSMVVGKRFPNKTQEILYGRKSSFSVSHFLELIDITILPHLDSPYFPNREERITEISKGYKGTIYGLRDDGAIIINNDVTTTIGSEAFVINN